MSWKHSWFWWKYYFSTCWCDWAFWEWIIRQRVLFVGFNLLSNHFFCGHLPLNVSAFYIFHIQLNSSYSTISYSIYLRKSILQIHCLHHLCYTCQGDQMLGERLTVKVYYWLKYNSDRSTTHPKSDPTRVQTHDFQIMTVHFMPLRCPS